MLLNSDFVDNVPIMFPLENDFLLICLIVQSQFWTSGVFRNGSHWRLNIKSSMALAGTFFQIPEALHSSFLLLSYKLRLSFSKF